MQITSAHVALGIVLVLMVIGWWQSRKTTLHLARLEAEALARKKLEEARAELPKICENCEHWDLAEGQAQIKQHPAFAAASQWASPRRMTTKFNDKGEPNESNVPMKCEWTQFGACAANTGEGRWKGDTCEKFQLKVTQ